MDAIAKDSQEKLVEAREQLATQRLIQSSVMARKAAQIYGAQGEGQQIGKILSVQSLGKQLFQHPYAPSTINLRLAAIGRRAYEASDCGLLSPDLAAGIRRVKGVRRLGVRVGNWLTAEEGKKLLGAENADNDHIGLQPDVPS